MDFDTVQPHVTVIHSSQSQARQTELRRDYELRYLAYSGHPLPAEFGNRWWPLTTTNATVKKLASVQ